jgi:hypothetical protein
MGEHIAIEQRIIQAEARWPGLQFKRKTGGEASSACPWCGGDDRFVICDNGRYFCRPAAGHCSKSGWIDENNPTPLSEEKRLELRVAALERKQAEHDKRLTALERMARCKDHIKYHRQMDADDMRDLWLEQGFWTETIDAYQLGVCRHCKTDQPQERMSMTIPVFFRGVPVNIRHRLMTLDGDRYRPHMAGLGNTLFNADDVYSDDTRSIIVAEGEKKAICLKQYGLGNVVGTMGKSGFQRAWASRFQRFGEVLICLDPDAQDKAREMATWFGDRARVVDLPVKSDDFFTHYRGTPDQFREFIKMARRIQ